MVSGIEVPTTFVEISLWLLPMDFRNLRQIWQPSKANEVAFELAIERVAAVAGELLDSLVTTAEPRNREVEAAKARARAEKRFGGGSAPEGAAQTAGA